MRWGLVLAGAATAALLLTVAAAVSLVQDETIRDCADATSAASEANAAHQDAMRRLEGRWRRGGVEAEVATLRLAETEGELDAARARLRLLCHYDAEQSTPGRT